MAFARRGFVAVAFLRRGYGRSQGEWAEDFGPCSDPDYAKAGLAGPSNIAAVARFMASQARLIDVSVPNVAPPSSLNRGSAQTLLRDLRKPRRLHRVRGVKITRRGKALVNSHPTSYRR